MAFDSSNLDRIGGGNGFNYFRYDTTDDLDVVEDAGYINNVDDDVELQVGDIIHAFSWTTAVRTGTLAAYKQFAVTRAIDRDASSQQGSVNLAEIGVASDGAISSGD